MITATKYYKPSEIKELHPFFEAFKKKSRQSLYSFIDNNLKKTTYRTGETKRFLILGQDILDFIKTIEK